MKTELNVSTDKAKIVKPKPQQYIAYSEDGNVSYRGTLEEIQSMMEEEEAECDEFTFYPVSQSVNVTLKKELVVLNKLEIL